MGRKTDNAYKTENDIFATRLRDLMDKKGLTQQRLADLTGFQRQTIGQYVNGTSKPDTDRLIKIAKALDVTPNLLLGFSTAETDNPSVAAIVDYTGLDDLAINNLHAFRKTIAIPSFVNHILHSYNRLAYLHSLFYAAAFAVGIGESNNNGKVSRSAHPRTKAKIFDITTGEISLSPSMAWSYFSQAAREKASGIADMAAATAIGKAEQDVKKIDTDDIEKEAKSFVQFLESGRIIENEEQDEDT